MSKYDYQIETCASCVGWGVLQNNKICRSCSGEGVYIKSKSGIYTLGFPKFIDFFTRKKRESLKSFSFIILTAFFTIFLFLIVILIVRSF